MTQDQRNLVWMDLEMTGLDPDNDHIIEIATIITDDVLNILAKGPVMAIHQPDERLALMDEWNQRTHGATGLIERVRASSVTEAAAERCTLEFLQGHVPPGVSPLCGNSICQDRRFLYRFMPQLEAYLHYRNLDVSTLKELARRWAPTVADSVIKHSTHQALDDILASIDELRYYRKHLIKVQ